jgi:hypothetical protein
MTLKNFEIEDDTVGLTFEGMYLDLHNCYDIEGFQYSNAEQVFQLKFRKGKYGTHESPESFELLFKNVSFLKIGERDAEMGASDDTCLEFIGFLPSESREIMDGYLTNMPKAPTDDLIINTYTGQAIKIQSASAEFISLDK